MPSGVLRSRYDCSKSFRFDFSSRSRTAEMESLLPMASAIFKRNAILVRCTAKRSSGHRVEPSNWIRHSTAFAGWVCLPATGAYRDAYRSSGDAAKI